MAPHPGNLSNVEESTNSLGWLFWWLIIFVMGWLLVLKQHRTPAISDQAVSSFFCKAVLLISMITRVILYTVFRCPSGLETTCWLFFWCLFANGNYISIWKSEGLHLINCQTLLSDCDLVTQTLVLREQEEIMLCRPHKVLIISYAAFGYSLKSSFVLEMFVMDQMLPIFLQLAWRTWNLNSVFQQVNRNVVIWLASSSLFWKGEAFDHKHWWKRA